MQNILSRINIFNLLIYRSILKSFCNKLVSQSKYNKISKNKKKFKKKRVLEKRVFEILI